MWLYTRVYRYDIESFHPNQSCLQGFTFSWDGKSDSVFKLLLTTTDFYEKLNKASKDKEIQNSPWRTIVEWDVLAESSGAQAKTPF